MLAFIDLEMRVPSDHPLRVIKRLADQALKALSPDLDRMYANVGRPSIPPPLTPYGFFNTFLTQGARSLQSCLSLGGWASCDLKGWVVTVQTSWDLSGVPSVGIGNLAMKDRSR